MVTSNAARTGVLSRMSLSRTTPRVTSPALVIGLGSTACQITRQIDEIRQVGLNLTRTRLDSST